MLLSQELEYEINYNKINDIFMT